MKVIVDEMPLCEYDCPFATEYDTGRSIKYDCSVTKEWCDLKCGACSGLKVLEGEKNNDQNFMRSISTVEARAEKGRTI